MSAVGEVRHGNIILLSRNPCLVGSPGTVWIPSLRAEIGRMRSGHGAEHHAGIGREVRRPVGVVQPGSTGFGCQGFEKLPGEALSRSEAFIRSHRWPACLSSQTKTAGSVHSQGAGPRNRAADVPACEQVAAAGNAASGRWTHFVKDGGYGRTDSGRERQRRRNHFP